MRDVSYFEICYCEEHNIHYGDVEPGCPECVQREEEDFEEYVTSVPCPETMGLNYMRFLYT